MSWCQYLRACILSEKICFIQKSAKLFLGKSTKLWKKHLIWTSFKPKFELYTKKSSLMAWLRKIDECNNKTQSSEVKEDKMTNWRKTTKTKWIDFKSWSNALNESNEKKPSWHEQVLNPNILCFRKKNSTHLSNVVNQVLASNVTE